MAANEIIISPKPVIEVQCRGMEERRFRLVAVRRERENRDKIGFVLAQK